MNFKACIKWLLVLVVLTVNLACNNKLETGNTELLRQTSKFINNQSAEALKILQSVSTGSLNEHNYNYYTLLQLRASWKAGNDISFAAADIEKVKLYFISVKDYDKASFACLVAGTLYSYQNNNLKAIYNYQYADEWAERVNYKTSDFDYWIIPYNIATVFSRDGDYIESNKYVQKASEYSSNDAKILMITNELAAINYRNLGNADSAWAYINKSVNYCDQIKDTINRNRILYNRNNILFELKEYSLVESKCKELIDNIKGKDPLYEGLSYITLAKTYYNTKRNKEASLYAHKAGDLLSNADIYYKTHLYDILYKTESNSAKAAQYKKQYNSCVAQNVNIRTVHRTVLQKELDAKNEEIFALKYQERQIVSEYKKERNILIVCLAMAFILILLGFVYLMKLKKKQTVTKVIKIDGSSILNSLQVAPYDPNKAGNELLAKVDKLIDENLDNPRFFLEDIASRLNTSKSTLYRHVKEYAKVTPTEIIKLKRLKKAAEYFSEGGDYNINEICYKVGFNSPSYFARCFREHFGLLPKEYAEKIKNENQVHP